MQGVIALLLAAAAPSVPVPMTTAAWRGMGTGQRVAYSEATVAALRRNPRLRDCAALTPGTLTTIVERNSQDDQPLMMAVAIAVYTLCPD